MEETRQKFRDDWSTLFPDNLIPDTSFLDSKEAVNNKLSSLEETVHNLRKQLQQEEFVLTWLRKLKCSKNFGNIFIPPEDNDSTNEEINELQQNRTSSFPGMTRYSSFGEVLYSPRPNSISSPTSANSSFDGFTSFSSFKGSRSSSRLSKNDSKEESDIVCEDAKPTFSSFSSRTEERIPSASSSVFTPSNEETSPKNNNPKRQPSLDRFRFNSSFEKLKDPDELENTVVNQSTDEQSEDDHVYENVDFIPTRRPTPKPRPKPQANYENVSVSVKSATAPNWSVKVDGSNKTEKELDANEKKSSTVPKPVKPSRSSKHVTAKQKPKKLGSQDRKGFHFEEFDTDESFEENANLDSEIENPVKNSEPGESCVDDDHTGHDHGSSGQKTPSMTPKISITKSEDYEDDDAHIYATVDDFMLGKSTPTPNSDSEDDIDTSVCTPSANYREMTSEEIMTLKRWDSDKDLKKGYYLIYFKV